MTYPPQDPYGQPSPHGQPDEPVPQYGYQVPGGFGVAEPAYSGPDPLVPPPGSGISGWFEWVRATLARSWRLLGLILLVTVAAPQIVVAVIGFAVGQAISPDAVDVVWPVEGPEFAVGLALGVLVVILATAFANALGWAAGIWAVTQQAAGRYVTLPEALRRGLARALPMFGWLVLTGLMIGVGLILCIVPGLYAAVATSLFAFLVMYERGTGPIGRSFSLVHSAFGAVLGRVVPLVLSVIIINFLVSCVFGAVTAAAAGAVGVAGVSGLQLVGEVVAALIGAGLEAVLLVGLLITYTQVRAGREPLSTPALVAAVSA